MSHDRLMQSDRIEILFWMKDHREELEDLSRIDLANRIFGKFGLMVATYTVGDLRNDLKWKRLYKKKSKEPEAAERAFDFNKEAEAFSLQVHKYAFFSEIGLTKDSSKAELINAIHAKLSGCYDGGLKTHLCDEFVQMRSKESAQLSQALILTMHYAHTFGCNIEDTIRDHFNVLTSRKAVPPAKDPFELNHE